MTIPDWALDDHAHLAHLVTRLLAAPLATLRRQGLGATRATLTLIGAGGPTAVTIRAPQPTTDAELLRRLLLAALPATGDEERGDGGITAVAVTLVAPRPLTGRQASFFDVPQGRRGLLAQGVEETRRRARGDLGHLHPADLTHPRPELRYRFVAVNDPLAPARTEGA